MDSNKTDSTLILQYKAQHKVYYKLHHSNYVDFFSCRKEFQENLEHYFITK